MFKISTQIKHKDLDTYKRLMNDFRPKNIEEDIKIKTNINLGDKTEKLMNRDSYRRINGKIRQIGWS